MFGGLKEGGVRVVGQWGSGAWLPFSGSPLLPPSETSNSVHYANLALCLISPDLSIKALRKGAPC